MEGEQGEGPVSRLELMLQPECLYLTKFLMSHAIQTHPSCKWVTSGEIRGRWKHCKKPGVVIHDCNPRTGKLGQKDFEFNTNLS